VKARELGVIASADATILCNSEEMTILRGELPAAIFHYLPWVIEGKTRAPAAFARRHGIMFLGGFGHRPNVDAVKHFVAEVMPRLRKLLPGVTFHVYGSKIPPAIEALAADDVVIEGHAKDLAAVFGRHRLSVAPLRFGAGFKGKLAVSLGEGVPAVASSIAIEGTGLRPARDVLVADDPDRFAAAIANLYRNQKLWRRLAQNGLRYVRENYSFARGRREFRAMLAALGRGT